MVSCREYAEIKLEELQKKVESFDRKPKLCVIQTGNDKASDSYINSKRKACEEVGIEFCHVHIEDHWHLSEENFIKIINMKNTDNSIDGIIIQLPIPEKYDIDKLQKYISPDKDVDGFRKDSYFTSCTPKGIIDWLNYNNYDFSGKNITVIGRSNIVGKPLVNLLIDRGATVTCCNSKTKYLISHTYGADMIISAVGKPKLFGYSYFNNPEIIIDVGISRYYNNKLCGDIDTYGFDEHLKNTYVTPVPGGVGKLTVCSLLDNVYKAYLIHLIREEKEKKYN